MKTSEKRHTFRTIRLALSLVWRSGRSQFIFIIAATIVTSLCVAGQLLIGRADPRPAGRREEVDAGELSPYLVALGVLLMVAALSQAVTSELRIPLGEKVTRRTMDEILDVATEVELEEYEISDFHDRLEQARFAAGGQSTAVVFGLVTVLSTLIVAIGVVAVLLAVVPVLVPIAVIGYLPIAYVNMRNNRATHELEWELTELQRERAYLEYVMTDRVEAKELRAYGIVPTLRRWHSGLLGQPDHPVAPVMRLRLALTTEGPSSPLRCSSATLSVAVILAGERIDLDRRRRGRDRGLQQLSGRLQSAGSAFGGVHQGVTFLRDFEKFRSALPAIRERRPVGVPPMPPRVLRSATSATGIRGRRRRPAVGRFELPARPDHGGGGCQRLGEVDAGEVALRVAAADTGDGRMGRHRPCRLRPDLVRSQMAPVFQDFSRYMFTIRQAIGLGDVAALDDEDGSCAPPSGRESTTSWRHVPEGLDARLGKMFSGGTDISSASGSDSPLPGRSSAMRRSSSWTNRQRRSTLVPKPTLRPAPDDVRIAS